MDRGQCLREAVRCVTTDRNATHGEPEDSFADIAALWSVILKRTVTLTEVALCLSALKMARLINNPSHPDSWVDLCGYGSLGCELATGCEVPPP